MAWIVNVVVALVVFCALPAQAQNYPAKPIHILVPYAPGGITDIAARIVGAKLTEAWGQQVIVENRPGGNGFIAMTAGAKAPADGYTLTMATVGDVAINPALFKDMPYDMERDFVPIALVSDAPMVLAANANAPFKTRRRGDRRRQGAARAHLGRHARQRQRQPDRAASGWRSTPAPSSSTSPTRAARRRRPRSPAARSRSACWRARRRCRTSSPGRVRVLAVTMAKRSKFSPEWPTLQEAGVKEVEPPIWTALFAPKGTPQPIIDKLNAEVVKILNMPDVKERFAGGGVETIPSSAAELDARVKQEAERFKVIVQKANIKPD